MRKKEKMIYIIGKALSGSLVRQREVTRSTPPRETRAWSSVKVVAKLIKNKKRRDNRQD
jgi:hypothetical protein